MSILTTFGVFPGFGHFGDFGDFGDFGYLCYFSYFGVLVGLGYPHITPIFGYQTVGGGRRSP